MQRPATSNRHRKKHLRLAVILCLAAVILFGQGLTAAAMAQSPARIVVLPFWVEKGEDIKSAGNTTLPYRRTMRFINNQLARHGFEVINPFARELGEAEYNRLMERAREDSPLAARDMCRKYGVDIAYVVWLTAKTTTTDDPLCKANVSLEGEGYDSAGRDLGAGLYKTFIVTRSDCDEALAEAQKEVGDLVGRRLTAWRGAGASTQTAVGGGGTGGMQTDGGAASTNAQKMETVVEVRLDGATEYTLAEIFGKVVSTATGVVDARRMSASLVPENPEASHATWQVRLEDTDPFRLQTNVMKMIDDVLEAGGELNMNGVPYRYTASEVDLLKGLRPGEATSRRIQFVIDRELARDRELGFAATSADIEKGLTGPQAETGASVNLRIEFDYDSYRIRPASHGYLDELGKALTGDLLNHKKIVIKGHTDSDGARAYNRKLSLNRAESVKDYLVGNFAIGAGRLRVVGHGETRPLVPNTTAANKQINRRVEIQAE